MIGGMMSVPITASMNSSSQERFFPCSGWEPNKLIGPAGVVASSRLMPVLADRPRSRGQSPRRAPLFLGKILVQQFLPLDVVRFVIGIKPVVEAFNAGRKRMRRLDIA